MANIECVAKATPATATAVPIKLAPPVRIAIPTKAATANTAIAVFQASVNSLDTLIKELFIPKTAF